MSTLVDKTLLQATDGHANLEASTVCSGRPEGWLTLPAPAHGHCPYRVLGYLASERWSVEAARRPEVWTLGMSESLVCRTCTTSCSVCHEGRTRPGLEMQAVSQPAYPTRACRTAAKS
eukprot:364133-Chlamydomonas_euryale.AAC.3